MAENVPRVEHQFQCSAAIFVCDPGVNSDITGSNDLIGPLRSSDRSAEFSMLIAVFPPSVTRSSVDFATVVATSLLRDSFNLTPEVATVEPRLRRLRTFSSTVLCTVVDARQTLATTVRRLVDRPLSTNILLNGYPVYFLDQDFADDIALIDSDENGLQQSTDATRETAGRVADQKRLNAFHTRCLRKILNISYLDRITNKEVYQRTNQTEVASMIRERRFRWFGHVMRMGDNRMAKKILDWKPCGGKRSRGRPRLTWKADVEKDLEAVGSSWYRATTQAQQRTRPDRLCSRDYRRKGRTQKDGKAQDHFETYRRLKNPPNGKTYPLPSTLRPCFRRPRTTKTKRQRSDSESFVSPRSGKTPTGPYDCPECGKRYSTSSNLARHRQTHRDQQDKKARKCPHCDKVYVSMPALSMHILTHNQSCKCPYCGKCFSRPWLLQGHIRTHTGERPFVCQICEKAFADKSNLRAHTQTHSDAKPYVCGRCGKAFALKSYLYNHEKSARLRSTKVTKSTTRQAHRQGAAYRRDPQAPIAVQG
ncbi:Zinc-finger of C2H2 type [Branchiostoma belcheri]|nr:Zinc-finger of C2H2 type [Branchiostoma belcheri]